MLFIINPISGGKKKDNVPDLIRNNLDSTLFDADIAFTNRAYHGRKLAQKAIGEYSYVVAVGGDGTINEIASAVAGTSTVLGIVPFGSGNGLSRFLGIPMDTTEAIRNLNERKIEAIDAAKFNRQWFFNMAGMGFDAHIAEVFSHDKSRGFWAYIKSSFAEIMGYKGETYHLEIDGVPYDREAFMLSIANSSQYGNNAHVSPGASVQDGLLDVCIIKHFPLYKFIGLSIRMFNGTADKSKYVEIIKGRHIAIRRVKDGPVHLDGEPQIMGQDIDIEIMPGALRIITGKTFKGEYPVAPHGEHKPAVNQ